jgi:hypothetical protein
MGKEAQVRARLADGVDEGRLQYEPPKLIFRGARRLTYQGEALAGVRAEAGDLVLPDGARFTLGEKQAKAWAEAILNPKGRLDKLGVKPGQRIAVLNLDDAEFRAELEGRVAATDMAADLDILFYGADSADELAAAAGLIERLGERGAIWVVSRKGAAATVKDVDVFAALRPMGLTDTKVCAFSETHTALRFARRR